MRTFNGLFGVAAFLMTLAILAVSSPAVAQSRDTTEETSPWSFPADVRPLTSAEKDVFAARNEEIFRLRQSRAWAEAAALLRTDVRAKEATLGPSHPVTGIAMGWLASTLEMLGQNSEAESLTIRSIGIGRRWLPDNHPSFCFQYMSLGSVQFAMGKPQSAEISLRHALDIARQSNDPQLVSWAREALSGLLEKTGRQQEAAQVRRQG